MALMLYYGLLQITEESGMEISWLPKDWKFEEIAKMSMISLGIQVLGHQWLYLFAHPDLQLQY